MEALREMSNERGVAATAMGVSAPRVAEIGKLAEARKIAASKETAKSIIARLAEKDAPAEEIAKELGLLQSSDLSAIDAAIDALLAQNPKPVQDYKAGKQQALGSLVGMVMKSNKGLAAALVQQRLRERLQ